MLLGTYFYYLVNINLIHEIVFSKQLLKNNGMLIIEHGANTHLETLIGFEKIKKYGNVNFSFFKNS